MVTKLKLKCFLKKRISLNNWQSIRYSNTFTEYIFIRLFWKSKMIIVIVFLILLIQFILGLDGHSSWCDIFVLYCFNMGAWKPTQLEIEKFNHHFNKFILKKCLKTSCFIKQNRVWKFVRKREKLGSLNNANIYLCFYLLLSQLLIYC